MSGGEHMCPHGRDQPDWKPLAELHPTCGASLPLLLLQRLQQRGLEYGTRQVTLRLSVPTCGVNLPLLLLQCLQPPLLPQPCAASALLAAAAAPVVRPALHTAAGRCRTLPACRLLLGLSRTSAAAGLCPLQSRWRLGLFRAATAARTCCPLLLCRRLRLSPGAPAAAAAGRCSCFRRRGLWRCCYRRCSRCGCRRRALTGARSSAAAAAARARPGPGVADHQALGCTRCGEETWRINHQ